MRVFFLRRLMGFANIIDGVLIIFTPFRPKFGLRVAVMIGKGNGRRMMRQSEQSRG